MAEINYLFIATITIVSIANAVDWCNIKSCGKEAGLHTMCRFPTTTPASKCGHYDTMNVTDEERQEILDAHNKFRASIANGEETRSRTGEPQPAGIIPPLQWDDELELVAQRWANQCDFHHDPCCDVERFYVGQNLAASSGTGGYTATMTGLVRIWYNEVKDFDPASVAHFGPQAYKAGHYTQLIWAKSTLVGCGVARYIKDVKWYTTYLVCNYGPGGNIVGARVYQTL